MKLIYKTVMFLTLLIFCIGSVCATDPDPTDPFIKKLIDDNHQLNTKVYNQSIEIKQLKDNNTQLDKRVKTLEESDKQKDIEIKNLNAKLDNQTSIINDLKADNKILNNKIDDLKADNKILNNKIDDLKAELDIRDNTINELNVELRKVYIEKEKANSEKDKANSEKDKIRIEKEELYEKLLISKNNTESLEKELKNKTNLIDNLNKEISNLNNKIADLNKEISDLDKKIELLKAGNAELKAKNISYSAVKKAIEGVDNYIRKHKKNPETVECGKISFNLKDFLNLHLIKDGKERIIKYKGKNQGVLPNYVVVAGHQVDRSIYKVLYKV